MSTHNTFSWRKKKNFSTFWLGKKAAYLGLQLQSLMKMLVHVHMYHILSLATFTGMSL